MKHIAVAITAVFFSVGAWAWPHVGDVAVYSVVTTGGPIPMSGTAAMTLTGINVNQDQMTVLVESDFDGYKQGQETTMSLSGFQNLANNMPDTLAHCAEKGGSAEQVSTPAGIFSCCKLQSLENRNTVYTWYTDVVFGFAKQVIVSPRGDSSQTYLLQSFKKGQ